MLCFLTDIISGYTALEKLQRLISQRQAGLQMASRNTFSYSNCLFRADKRFPYFVGVLLFFERWDKIR